MRQQIAEMGGIVVNMVRTAMEAFARRDLDAVPEAAVDGRPRRSIEPLHAPRGIEARRRSAQPGLGYAHEHGGARLERVGDNAVDIGEQVGFLITGEFREFTDASHPVDA